ncbi:MAG: hypothetical protein LBG47_07015 [Prevotellaceae bacterium]|nr:hypothetical protein [Prevotellaceae bacterium]
MIAGACSAVETHAVRLAARVSLRIAPQRHFVAEARAARLYSAISPLFSSPSASKKELTQNLLL